MRAEGILCLIRVEPKAWITSQLGVFHWGGAESWSLGLRMGNFVADRATDRHPGRYRAVMGHLDHEMLLPGQGILVLACQSDPFT